MNWWLKPMAPSAKSWGLPSALPIYSSVNQASQPRSGLWADTWDEFSDSKSGAVPAFCGCLTAPENRVAGGHLLSRPWLCCVSYKNVFAGAQTAREGNVCPRHGSSHVMGRTKHLLSSSRGLNPHGCSHAMWGVPEQGHGLLTPRRASLMSSLQMWQGANEIVRVRHLKGRHSGVENIRQVQTANVMPRSLQKLGNEEMIVYCFILWSCHITNNGTELQHRIKPIRVWFWVINKGKTLKIIWRNEKITPCMKRQCKCLQLQSSLICK